MPKYYVRGIIKIAALGKSSLPDAEITRFDIPLQFEEKVFRTVDSETEDDAVDCTYNATVAALANDKKIYITKHDWLWHEVLPAGVDAVLREIGAPLLPGMENV